MADLKKNNGKDTDRNTIQKDAKRRNKLNPKQIAAWIGIILLVLLYVGLLVQALTFGPDAGQIFMSALTGTITIPIVVWLFIWVYGVYARKHTIASLDAMTSDQMHDEDGNVIRTQPEGKIRTVIFDIGNVLVNFDWKNLYLSKGNSEEMAERMAAASVYDSDWNEYDRGVLTDEQILDSFVENDPEIETQLRTALENMKGMITLRPETVPWIRALKAQGYQVLVLSNFSHKALKDCKEDMRFLDEVDGGILSYREHLIKPDPAIYQLLMERYQLDPDACIFIDDTEPNVKAAAALGIHAIHFESRQQVLAEMEALGVVTDAQ